MNKPINPDTGLTAEEEVELLLGDGNEDFELEENDEDLLIDDIMEVDCGPVGEGNFRIPFPHKIDVQNPLQLHMHVVEVPDSKSRPSCKTSRVFRQ